MRCLYVLILFLSSDVSSLPSLTLTVLKSGEKMFCTFARDHRPHREIIDFKGVFSTSFFISFLLPSLFVINDEPHLTELLFFIFHSPAFLCFMYLTHTHTHTPDTMYGKLIKEPCSPVVYAIITPVRTLHWQSGSAFQLFQNQQEKSDKHFSNTKQLYVFEGNKNMLVTK